MKYYRYELDLNTYLIQADEKSYKYRKIRFKGHTWFTANEEFIPSDYTAGILTHLTEEEFFVEFL